MKFKRIVKAYLSFTIFSLSILYLVFASKKIDKSSEVAGVLDRGQKNFYGTTKLSGLVHDHLERTNRLPSFVHFNNQQYTIDYVWDLGLQSYLRTLLSHHRADYTAVAVIDNDNGRILALEGVERVSGEFNQKLVLSTTHPAASLFKVVSAAELIEGAEFDKESELGIPGRSTTLYRSQVFSKNHTRWQKAVSLKRAFASSNNSYFGKAAIQNLGSIALIERAEQFGLGKDLLIELPLKESKVFVPTTEFELAELASGFNTKTLISPVHAAVMASIVANEGHFLRPKLIDQIYSPVTQERIFRQIPTSKTQMLSVIKKETAEELKKLMKETVTSGTARASFKRLSQDIERTLEIGGKTGTITGGEPYGQRDWFMAFAIPKDPALGKGISLAVMNVNGKNWYVKSSFIARRIIEYYFENILSLKIQKNKYARNRETSSL
jgi:penicillin-binding protein A